MQGGEEEANKVGTQQLGSWATHATEYYKLRRISAEKKHQHVNLIAVARSLSWLLLVSGECRNPDSLDTTDGATKVAKGYYGHKAEGDTSKTS